MKIPLPELIHAHRARCPRRSLFQVAWLWLGWGCKLLFGLVLDVRRRPLVQGGTTAREVLEFWDREVGKFWRADSPLGKTRARLVSAALREEEHMRWAREEFVWTWGQGLMGIALWYLTRFAYLFAATFALGATWDHGGRDDFIRGYPRAAFVAYAVADAVTTLSAPILAELNDVGESYYHVSNPLPWTVLLPAGHAPAGKPKANP
jgi:hypothetical protein